MNNLKYIRMKEDIIIFPVHIDHRTMARNLLGRVSSLYNKDDLISAGFVSLTESCNPNFDNPGFICHGRSVSLDIGSRPEDTKLLNRQYYGTSYEE